MIVKHFLGARVMKQKLGIVVLCCFLVISLRAQESGKLTNRLTYHLLHHEVPKRSASVWFVLRGGRMDEEEHQRGLTHFHLVWRGAEHLSEEQIRENFSLLDITKEPAHISSFTGTDITLFRMNIALDRPQVLERALSMLKEAISAATLLSVVVEDERQEVTKEIANKIADPYVQTREMQISILLGKPFHYFSEEFLENLHNATAEELQSFYHWKYRPYQMILIAVGDFNEGSFKESIEEYFGSLSNPPAREWNKEEQICQQTESSCLTVENEAFELPKVSVAYLLSREVENEIRQRRRVVLSTWSMQTMVSRRYQLVEIGVVLFGETSILSDAGHFMDRVSQIEEGNFTEQGWIILQEMWNVWKPIGNEIYAKAYMEHSLGYLPSKPLKVLANDEEQETDTTSYGGFLKNYPKIITTLVRAKKTIAQ